MATLPEEEPGEKHGERTESWKKGYTAAISTCHKQCSKIVNQLAASCFSEHIFVVDYIYWKNYKKNNVMLDIPGLIPSCEGLIAQSKEHCRVCGNNKMPFTWQYAFKKINAYCHVKLRHFNVYRVPVWGHHKDLAALLHCCVKHVLISESNFTGQIF